MITVGLQATEATLAALLAQEAKLVAGTPTETAVSVGTGNTAVLSANASRKFLSLINDSPNTIYVALSGNNAALNTGTMLAPRGGSVFFDRYIPRAAVKAIATGAASNLLVTEG